MRSLIETIKAHETRLEMFELSPQSECLAKDTLYHLRSHQTLLRLITDEMIPGKKFCYRYGKLVVEQCEVCEVCLEPEDLAWNEGDV